MRAQRHSHRSDVFLQPGDFYYAGRPAVVETILGSCVAVTMFSPERRTGAICHAMLPAFSEGSRAGEYVEGAINAILHRMLSHGAEKGELEVKLFGGSTVISPGSAEKTETNSIGEQNLHAAIKTLESLNITLAARDTGGDTGRKLFFYTATGDVFVRRQKSSPAKRAFENKGVING